MYSLFGNYCTKIHFWKISELYSLSVNYCLKDTAKSGNTHIQHTLFFVQKPPINLLNEHWLCLTFDVFLMNFLTTLALIKHGVVSCLKSSLQHVLTPIICRQETSHSAEVTSFTVMFARTPFLWPVLQNKTSNQATEILQVSLAWSSFEGDWKVEGYSQPASEWHPVVLIWKNTTLNTYAELLLFPSVLSSGNNWCRQAWWAYLKFIQNWLKFKRCLSLFFSLIFQIESFMKMHLFVSDVIQLTTHFITQYAKNWVTNISSHMFVCVTYCQRSSVSCALSWFLNWCYILCLDFHASCVFKFSSVLSCVSPSVC